MSLIRSKDTKVELLVFSSLRKKGIYFRKHYKKAAGTPDVCLPRKKLAVFIDGDFWHGYRYNSWKKRLSSSFWTGKIERNIARDKRTFRKLRASGWKVMRVWEHQLQDEPEKYTSKIIEFLHADKKTTIDLK